MDVALSSIQRWVTQYRKEQKGITPKPSAVMPKEMAIARLGRNYCRLNFRH